MAYFSNKPAPTPGPQLPFPKSNKIIDKDREAKKPSLKRKQNGGDVGKLNRFVEFCVAIEIFDRCFFYSL